MGTSKLFGDKLTKCWEVTCDGQESQPWGVESIHFTETGDERRPDWPMAIGTDFALVKYTITDARRCLKI